MLIEAMDDDSTVYQWRRRYVRKNQSKLVPTLTAKLQEHIKASILKQTTVEIKEVNVKIRGVYIEPQKK